MKRLEAFLSSHRLHASFLLCPSPQVFAFLTSFLLLRSRLRLTYRTTMFEAFLVKFSLDTTLTSDCTVRRSDLLRMANVKHKDVFRSVGSCGNPTIPMA